MNYSRLSSSGGEDGVEHLETQELGGDPSKGRAPGGGQTRWTESRQKRWRPTPRAILILVGASVLVGTLLSQTVETNQYWQRSKFGTVKKPTRPLDYSLILNNPEKPQDSLASQLKPEVRYITSLSYGGHANQFIGIQNLLYLGKLLNRVVIVPTLTALHFKGEPQDMSQFYDLEGFYRETSIALVELSTLKWWNATNPPPIEPLTCWSVLERVAEGRNINDGSMAVHMIDIKYYPLPKLARGTDVSMIWFAALHEFDSEPWSKQQWIDKVRAESLPHVVKDAELNSSDSTPETKPGFDPSHTDPPSDQLLCLDTTFFTGSRILPPAYPTSPPAEPLRYYEGDGWIQAGQYLHFSKNLEALADRYLEKLFGVSSARSLPPFITCHIRRGDFAQARGLTSLDKFTDAVQRVRDSLDWRMDHRDGWDGPGKGNERFVDGWRGSDYAVVVATDEKMDSEFVKTVREELGWKVIDHDSMQTERDLGAWYTLLIDSVILSRGQGFVGTEWSTFSYLAALRVQYWNGGVQDWTPAS